MEERKGRPPFKYPWVGSKRLSEIDTAEKIKEIVVETD